MENDTHNETPDPGDPRERLVQAGHRAFSSLGWKATQVADLAREAGMATGSFYKHFPSKEALFAEVYVRENRRVKETIFAEADPTLPPDRFVAALLAANARHMAANPVLQAWYDPDLMARLEKDFAASGAMETLQARMEGDQLAMIRQWKQAGFLRTDLEDGMISAIFRALPWVELHKDRIGPAWFPRLMDELVTLVMRGLRP